MRPRVFPAEDNDDYDFSSLRPLASMRPRVFPAEDRDDHARRAAPRARFNEAAGIPRGRQAGDSRAEGAPLELQ